MAMVLASTLFVSILASTTAARHNQRSSQHMGVQPSGAQVAAPISMWTQLPQPEQERAVWAFVELYVSIEIPKMTGVAVEDGFEVERVFLCEDLDKLGLQVHEDMPTADLVYNMLVHLVGTVGVFERGKHKTFADAWVKAIAKVWKRTMKGAVSAQLMLSLHEVRMRILQAVKSFEEASDPWVMAKKFHIEVLNWECQVSKSWELRDAECDVHIFFRYVGGLYFSGALSREVSTAKTQGNDAVLFESYDVIMHLLMYRVGQQKLNKMNFKGFQAKQVVDSTTVYTAVLIEKLKQGAFNQGKSPELLRLVEEISKQLRKKWSALGRGTELSKADKEKAMLVSAFKLHVARVRVLEGVGVLHEVKDQWTIAAILYFVTVPKMCTKEQWLKYAQILACYVNEKSKDAPLGCDPLKPKSKTVKEAIELVATIGGKADRAHKEDVKDKMDAAIQMKSWRPWPEVLRDS